MSTIINATTTNGVVIQPDNSGSLALQTNNGTTALTVDTSQNTTFAGKVTSAGALTLASNGTTTAVTIDTSQRIGIGTASPGYLLNVSANGGGGDSAQLVRFTDTSTANSIGPLHLTIGAANHFAGNPSPVLCGTNGIAFGVGDGSDLASQRKMTIDSSGNVLVGTAAAPSASQAGVKICSPLVAYSAFSAGNNNGEYYQIGFLNGNGLIGRISTNGSATSYVTSSDYRLKNNIVPMIGALDKVAQLKPVTYTWIADGSSGQGFIAHELQAIVPECVSGEKDAEDEEGNIKPQGVDTSFLVATLTAAIQEQQTIINDLKARVEALEAK